MLFLSNILHLLLGQWKLESLLSKQIKVDRRSTKRHTEILNFHKILEASKPKKLIHFMTSPNFLDFWQPLCIWIVLRIILYTLDAKERCQFAVEDSLQTVLQLLLRLLWMEPSYRYSVYSKAKRVLHPENFELDYTCWNCLCSTGACKDGCSYDEFVGGKIVESVCFRV